MSEPLGEFSMLHTLAGCRAAPYKTVRRNRVFQTDAAPLNEAPPPFAHRGLGQLLSQGKALLVCTSAQPSTTCARLTGEAGNARLRASNTRCKRWSSPIMSRLFGLPVLLAL